MSTWRSGQLGVGQADHLGQLRVHAVGKRPERQQGFEEVVGSGGLLADALEETQAVPLRPAIRPEEIRDGPVLVQAEIGHGNTTKRKDGSALADSGGNLQIGDLGNEIVDLQQMALLERVTANCRNRNRHVLQSFRPLLGRNDNFVAARIVGCC